MRYKWSEDMALSLFADNGNVFFSNDQIQKFEASYDDLSGVPEACRAEAQKNKIYDNFSYSYDQLLRNPKLLWEKNFFAYGLAFNLLTPIGSINFAYGLPWKEPKSPACLQDRNECHIRSTTKGHWLTRGEFHINVGAQF